MIIEKRPLAGTRSIKEVNDVRRSGFLLKMTLFTKLMMSKIG